MISHISQGDTVVYDLLVLGVEIALRIILLQKNAKHRTKEINTAKLPKRIRLIFSKNRRNEERRNSDSDANYPERNRCAVLFDTLTIPIYEIAELPSNPRVPPRGVRFPVLTSFTVRPHIPCFHGLHSSSTKGTRAVATPDEKTRKIQW